MAQADGVVANGTGSAVRADINGQLAALFTNHSGSTEPATTFAFQTWADTNTNTLKLRNSSNDGWVQLARLDGQFDAKTFNGNVTLNAQSDLRLADSDSSNWVAFQAPATVTSNTTFTLPDGDGTSGQTLITNGSGTLSWSTPSASVDKIEEGNTTAEVVDTGSDGHFKVVTEGTEALRVDASQRLGVGTTSPNTRFVVSNSGAEGVEFDPGYTSGASSILAYNRSGSAYTDLKFEAAQYALNIGASEKARLDSSGRLLVGTTAARNFFSWGTLQAQIEGIGFTQSSLSLYNNENSVNGAVFALGHSRGTSVGSNTIVNNGDYFGAISFYGSDGSNELRGAEIGAYVDGTPGSNDMPGRLVFSTTADGASSPTARMTLYSNGNIRAVETASAYFYPGIDNSIYLGSPSFRYNLVYSVNGTASSSDEREKTEISNATLGTDFIKSLRPVSYKWIEGGKVDSGELDENGDPVYESVPGQRTHWGFIAQEVKQAADDAGVDFGGWILTDVDDPESPQGLRYQQFIAPLTKALQEAIAKIETLETANASLEARLTALESA